MYTVKLLPTPKLNLIGHRGVKGLRPENTMTSFKYALELGLNWIEFDVRLSKCNTWVVMHDIELDRTTNGKGKITECNLDYIKSLEAGLWFDRPYPKVGIPILSEVVNLSHENNLNLNIEVKLESDDVELYATKMSEFLNQHYPDNYAKPLISSFNIEFLEKLRKLEPTIPIGYLVDNPNLDHISRVKAYQFTSLNTNYKHLDSHILKSAQKEHIPILVYTVNDPDIASTLIEHGVHAVITDRPDLVIDRNIR